MNELVISASELQAYLGEIYPQTQDRFDILHLEPMSIKMLWKTSSDDLRPGKTLSGPALFTLADCSFYAITLAMIGKKPLAVTTNLSINFMRRSELVDLVAHTRILKLGKNLCVGDALICAAHNTTPIAHASITYALSPNGPTSTL